MGAPVDIAEPKAQKITINGEDFPLLLSDVDILDAALRLSKSAAEIGPDSAPDEIVGAARKIVSAIEGMIGPAALRKLAGGRPAPIDWAVKLLSAITAAAGQSYSDAFDENYD